MCYAAWMHMDHRIRLWMELTSQPATGEVTTTGIHNPPRSSLPGDSSPIRSSQRPHGRIIGWFLCPSPAGEHQSLHSCQVWARSAPFLPSAHYVKVTHATVCRSGHSLMAVQSTRCPLTLWTHGLLPSRLFLYGCYGQTSSLWWIHFSNNHFQVGITASQIGMCSFRDSYRTISQVVAPVTPLPKSVQVLQWLQIPADPRCYNFKSRSF